MKYLGIDFGSKKVGLATSDDNGEMAFPYCVIENNKNLLENILEVIEKENVEVVIIGESKNFKNEPNKIMKVIEKFKENLEKETNLKIYLEPEFMTSQQAERLQGKNEMLDASSATIILQSFLDKQ